MFETAELPAAEISAVMLCGGNAVLIDDFGRRDNKACVPVDGFYVWEALVADGKMVGCSIEGSWRFVDSEHGLVWTACIAVEIKARSLDVS